MRPILLIIGLLTLTLIDRPSASAAEPSPALAVNCTSNTQLIQAFEVFELTFQHANTYSNPFFDVTLDVTFTSPAGKVISIGGFHYGSLDKPKINLLAADRNWRHRNVEYTFDKSDIWKARFAPNQTGRWTYAWTFRNNKSEQAEGTGVFTCVKGRIPNPGFVRQDPQNPYLWIFDDGSPFIPIGLQDCMRDEKGLGTFLATMQMEGPFKPGRDADWPALPEGAAFKPGPSFNPQNGDVYFRRYSRAGFNLFRYSQVNCSPPLTENLDRYLPQEAIMTDELLLMLRKYHMRIMYGIFGYQKVFNDAPDNAQGMEKVKRFVKYSVDRWGAYIDFWEMLNEQNADDRWYKIVVPYLRSIDPYHHPVATSWERPKLDGIDINSPHWYAERDDVNPDLAVVKLATEWKKFHKPVIIGEQGNHTAQNPTSRPTGVGGCWDPTSAVRMRIRNWACLFNQISLIFWNTSGVKDYYMNIWLGPHEREYVRAMQDFAYCLGGGVKPIPVTLSSHDSVRAYGLANERRAAAYLHHFKDHVTPIKNLSITLDVPRAARAYWYNAATAEIYKEVDLAAGNQTLAVPDFTIDIALLITPDGCPDIDKDGIPNDVDTDNDNDGVPNAQDAFPLEPEEWADVDNDGIGDNLDADKNGDGIADDDNHNGIPDCEEMDLDGDGVPRAAAVPWDAFPNDPKEWNDTDGDGIGDNADPDIDGDGFTNDEERKAGADPYNKLSFPAE